ELAKKHKGASCKLIKVPILLDPERMKYGHTENDELTAKKYLFHSGTLTQQKDGIVQVLEAFSLATQRLPFKVNYFFTGRAENSSDNSLILSAIDKYALQDKVVFLGYLDDLELASYIMNADGFIINKLDNQQNKYCFA